METYIKTKKLIDEKQFDTIADLLLNKTYLTVNKKNFRIAEIEFYLYSNSHKDTYTHCSKDQMAYGCWYFHKHHNGSYKGGTYKGLDITLGCEQKTINGDCDDIYCGVLIRSIYDEETKEVTEGPCKTVDKILKSYDEKSVSDFVGKYCDEKKNLSAIDNKGRFIISNISKSISTSFLKGPRIGLSEKFPDYKNKLYRYVGNFCSVKKMKKYLV